MNGRFIRWSYLFAVIVCALVVGLGGWWSQHEQNISLDRQDAVRLAKLADRLDKVDHFSCQNRRNLAANQVVVLHMLLNIARREEAETDEKHPAPVHAIDYWRSQEFVLIRALDSIAATPTCSP